MQKKSSPKYESYRSKVIGKVRWLSRGYLSNSFSDFPSVSYTCFIHPCTHITGSPSSRPLSPSPYNAAVPKGPAFGFLHYSSKTKSQVNLTCMRRALSRTNSIKIYWKSKHKAFPADGRDALKHQPYVENSGPPVPKQGTRWSLTESELVLDAVFSFWSALCR